MPTIYNKDMLYVPADIVSKADLKTHLRRDHFDDRQCRHAGEGGRYCEERSDRPTEVCQTCPAYYGRYKFYRKETINGEKYVGLAKGDESLLYTLLGNPKDYTVEDLRTRAPMQNALAFQMDRLHPFQVTAVEEMMRKTRGLLKSAPRTGKTVMLAALACQLGQRTIIFTHQDDLLKQFYETFQTFTNVSDLPEQTVVLAKSNKDLKHDADVLLTTYQRFLSKAGQKRLKHLSAQYGCVLVDEIHRGNADGYSRVISRMAPLYIYGCSGTLKRKDGKEFIMQKVLGPLLHETDAQALTPKVIVQVTKMQHKPQDAKLWTTIIKRLYLDKDRHRDIVQQVITDVQDGYSIVIPVIHRGYIDALVEDINKEWMQRTGSEERPAAAFYRYSNPAKKEDILERARDGRLKVVVALRSMLLGVNVPRWSMLYEITPINNAPGFEQETLRICTAMDGKKPPIIRFYVDVMSSPSVACFWSCWKQMQKMKFNTQGNSKVLAEIGRPHSRSTVFSAGIPGRRMTRF